MPAATTSAASRRSTPGPTPPSGWGGSVDVLGKVAGTWLRNDGRGADVARRDTDLAVARHGCKCDGGRSDAGLVGVRGCIVDRVVAGLDGHERPFDGQTVNRRAFQVEERACNGERIVAGDGAPHGHGRGGRYLSVVAERGHRCRQQGSRRPRDRRSTEFGPSWHPPLPRNLCPAAQTRSFAA